MDQADKLRKLIRTADESPREVVGPLPMICISGARTGVGATTVAVNLAAVLADRGERVLLVDADEGANALADVAAVSREIEFGVEEVLSGETSISEAIVSGPVGLRVLANRRRPRRDTARREPGALIGSASERNSQIVPETSRTGLQRLLAGLDSVREEVDLVVVDTGSGVTPWTRRFWLRSQLVVLVTTAEDSAVMDAYAAIKRGTSEGIRPAVRVLVNQAESEQLAKDAAQRLQIACRRFLSIELEALQPLPSHLEADGTRAFGSLRVWEAPESEYARAMLWVGKGVRDFVRPDCSGVCESERSIGNNSGLVSNVR
jgi:flagellar biosynthesis protein FlhG